eukprot:tig00001384_g8552.t1
MLGLESLPRDLLVQICVALGPVDVHRARRACCALRDAAGEARWHGAAISIQLDASCSWALQLDSLERLAQAGRLGAPSGVAISGLQLKPRPERERGAGGQPEGLLAALAGLGALRSARLECGAAQREDGDQERAAARAALLVGALRALRPAEALQPSPGAGAGPPSGPLRSFSFACAPAEDADADGRPALPPGAWGPLLEALGLHPALEELNVPLPPPPGGAGWLAALSDRLPALRLFALDRPESLPGLAGAASLRELRLPPFPEPALAAGLASLGGTPAGDSLRALVFPPDSVLECTGSLARALASFPRLERVAGWLKLRVASAADGVGVECFRALLRLPALASLQLRLQCLEHVRALPGALRGAPALRALDLHVRVGTACVRSGPRAPSAFGDLLAAAAAGAAATGALRSLELSAPLDAPAAAALAAALGPRSSPPPQSRSASPYPSRTKRASRRACGSCAPWRPSAPACASP